MKERRQQIDIPEPKAITTEYRQMQVRCGCGLDHYGEFPQGITPNVSYGARLKAYSVGLVQGHFVALERISEIIHDQYGVQPFGGTIQKWILQVADYLAADYAANQQSIVRAKVANFDESGVSINAKLHWLHVATAHYSIHEKRGYLGGFCRALSVSPCMIIGNLIGITTIVAMRCVMPIICVNCVIASN